MSNVCKLSCKEAAKRSEMEVIIVGGVSYLLDKTTKIVYNLYSVRVGLWDAENKKVFEVEEESNYAKLVAAINSHLDRDDLDWDGCSH
jgi:hypothetical protein